MYLIVEIKSKQVLSISSYKEEKMAKEEKKFIIKNDKTYEFDVKKLCRMEKKNILLLGIILIVVHQPKETTTHFK